MEQVARLREDMRPINPTPYKVSVTNELYTRLPLRGSRKPIRRSISVRLSPRNTARARAGHHPLGGLGLPPLLLDGAPAAGDDAGGAAS